MIPLILALACVPVDGPKLLAKHMAAVIAEFAQLPATTDLGYAPSPGVVRTMRADELSRTASKHGVALVSPAVDICFEWPLKPLEVEQATASMREALPAETQLEVLELSRAPVPEGVIEFPLDRLQGNIWRGSVRYNGAGAGRFDIWARVRIASKQTRVVTLAPLRTGDALTAAQLRLEEFEGAPAGDLLTSVEDAVGLIAKRSVPSGTALKAMYLDRPAVVSKGDTVQLRTNVGVAHVVVEASAQAPGKIGDIIPVKNASSGRVLRARIEAPGEVRLAQ